MLSGEELEAKVAELKEAGYDNKQIIEAIVNEDYDVPAGQLSKLLGVPPLDVGRVKGAIRRKRQPPGGEGGPASDWLSEQPPMAQRLYEALSRVMPKSLDKAKAITDIFTRNIAHFQNRHMFRSWLSRYGLPADAMAQVEDEIYGFEMGAPPGGQYTPGQGQPTVAYVPQPGGGYAPIIVMSQPPSMPQWPGGNITFTVPPSPPPSESKPSPELNLLREEVKAIKDSFKELSQQMVDLVHLVRTPPPSPSPQPPPPPPPRMRRRPMLDEEGRILRDVDGNVLYEEVPYDETQAQLEYMRGIAALSRREETGLSAESIRNIINDELSKREVQQQRFNELQDRIMAEIDRRFPEKEGKSRGITAEEVRNIIKDELDRGISAEEVRNIIKDELDRRTEPQQAREILELRQRIDNIMREREQSEETRRIIGEQIEPILRKMEDLELQTQRATLTGESARLAHAETIADSWQRFFRDMGQSLERSVRAGLLANVVAQMRAANVPDSLIGEVIKSAGGLPEVETELERKPSSIRERAAQFRARYLKPEG